MFFDTVYLIAAPLYGTVGFKWSSVDIETFFARVPVGQPVVEKTVTELAMYITKWM